MNRQKCLFFLALLISSQSIRGVNQITTRQSPTLTGLQLEKLIRDDEIQNKLQSADWSGSGLLTIRDRIYGYKRILVEGSGDCPFKGCEGKPIDRNDPHTLRRGTRHIMHHLMIGEHEISQTKHFYQLDDSDPFQSITLRELMEKIENSQESPLKVLALVDTDAPESPENE